MTNDTPPSSDYLNAFEGAVRRYWTVRAEQAKKQADAGKLDAGTRGEVTGGAHLDAMAELVEQLFIDAGISSDKIHRRGKLNLSGYYRPAKEWDLLVLDGDRLIAAIEFKSQVGPSFGNNYNNRCEEAIGTATDLWAAYKAGLLGDTKPWVAYMMFLQEAPGSTKDVKIPSLTPYTADPVFGVSPSYKNRYAILLDRLFKDDVYSAACFVTSSADPTAPIHEPVAELSFQNFAAAVKGRANQVLNMQPPKPAGGVLP